MGGGGGLGGAEVRRDLQGDLGEPATTPSFRGWPRLSRAALSCCGTGAGVRHRWCSGNFSAPGASEPRRFIEHTAAVPATQPRRAMHPHGWRRPRARTPQHVEGCARRARPRPLCRCMFDKTAGHASLKPTSDGVKSSSSHRVAGSFDKQRPRRWLRRLQAC